MLDFLSEIRTEMVENFQISLRAIRLLMGYSAAELASYVGVTRQTINNLETGKAKMSPMQFISLAAVVDHYAASNGEMFQAIVAIIDGNYRKANRSYDSSFSDFSLLRRWFATFDSVDDPNTMVNNGESEDPDLLLQRLVGNYKLFLDADVLLSENAETFVTCLAKQLSSKSSEVIIPLRAVEQLQDLTQEASASERAVKALRLISFLQRNALVQIRGEDDDATLHETLLAVFAKFRSMHRLCMLTQDSVFADETLQLNHAPDVQGFDILAGYVDEQGYIVLYPDSEPVPMVEDGEFLDDGTDLLDEDEEMVSGEDVEKIVRLTCAVGGSYKTKEVFC